MGRGLLQWWQTGAQVHDELPNADHTYRDALITLSRQAEVNPDPPHQQLPE
jgi:hypothetical protein